MLRCKKANTKLLLRIISNICLPLLWNIRPYVTSTRACQYEPAVKLRPGAVQYGGYLLSGGPVEAGRRLARYYGGAGGGMARDGRANTGTLACDPRLLLYWSSIAPLLFLYCY
jgi:hypothetical protein